MIEDKEFFVGDFVMIRNNLDFNGNVGIVVDRHSDGDYIENLSYKVFVKNQVHWFYYYEVQDAEV